MTLAIREPSASSPRTTSWGFPPIGEVSADKTPATTKGVVIYGDFSSSAISEQLPNGYQNIDDLVEEHERDPVRRAAIEAGRKLIAERYYKETEGLAALRLRRGWSQRALAEAVGIKQPHIARLESGHNDPSLGTMRKLAAALEVTIEEIVRALDSAR
jgi:DNA-binding XRE family transcriptional regulator